MATAETSLQFQFPYRNYSKYRSQSKTNPLFNKLSEDTGYPQDVFASISSIHSHRNYLEDNKKNLKNFFADRLPPKSTAISKESHSIDPSRLFEIKRKQYELKNQAKIMLNKTIDIKSEPFGVQPQKISQIFLVNDKNLDFKKKFLEEDGTRIVEPYQTINFRRGTQSYMRKCSHVAKKDAYNTVFGPDVSQTPKRKLNKTTRQWLSHRENKQTVCTTSRKASRTALDNKTRQDNKKRFSSLIQKVDRHRQKLDPDNRMAIKPYRPPVQQEDHGNQKDLMLTWIRDIAKSYKNNSININTDRLRKLQDVVKMDEKYYHDMVEHKNKRLYVRSLLLAKGGNIKQFNKSVDFNESGMDIMREILENIQKGDKLEQNLSISAEAEDNSTLSSEDEDEIVIIGPYLTILERFQKFSQILVYTLYRANFYGISDNHSIYNAFWKNPVPFEKSGSYAFFKAIKKGDLIGIKNFLDTDPNFLYERDHKGRSPLIYACLNNHSHLIKFFLSKPINVDHKCKRKRTALYYALRHQNEQNIKDLLLAGANVWSTQYNPIGAMTDKNPNKRIKMLIKNTRKLSIAIGLQPNRLMKLEYWRANKHLINSEKVICF